MSVDSNSSAVRPAVSTPLANVAGQMTKGGWIELVAAVKECQVDDAKVFLSALRERVGEAPFREAFFAVLSGEAGENDIPDPLPVGHFLASIPDRPPMQVEGLIPVNSLVLITAKPKFMKSLMALDILDSVAEAKPVFEHFAVNKSGPVVYVGMEDGPVEIANRLLKRGHRTTEEASNLHIIAARVILGNVASVAKLRQKLESLKPVLIVIDTGREALGVKDWNDAAEMSDKLRPLRELAREFCTVVLVAHNRKAAGEDGGDEIGGTNALASSVDGWLSLIKKERLANGNVRLTVSAQGRGGMHESGGEFVVEMDTQTTRFHLVSEEELTSFAADQRKEKEGAKAELILQALTEIGKPSTKREIAEHLKRDEEWTRRAVETLLTSGQVVQHDEKRAGKGRAAVLYALPQPFALVPPPYPDSDEPELF